DDPPGTSTASGSPLAVVSGPTLTTPADAPLSRGLTVATDRPTRLTVTVTTDAGSRTVTYPDLATAHDVPVHGLAPGGVTSLAVHLEADDGAAIDPTSLEVEADPLPAGFPWIEQVAWDGERAEPGCWLVSLEVPDGTGWLAAIDPATAEVRWLYVGANFGDARQTEVGTYLGLASGAIEVDGLGAVLRRWTRGSPDEVIPIPWASLHHEVFPLADGGFASLTSRRAVSPAYPRSYDDPTPDGPADIVEDAVVGFDADGAARFDWSLADRLDPSRIGFDSLDPIAGGFDWSHANAVVPWGADGLLVSVRHQDALVALGPDGAVRWILGDPAGWGPATAPRVLTPVGAPDWAYHAHGPAVADDGTIAVFDNHPWDRTPYTAGTATGTTSRVVAYGVDEAAGTVERLWSWVPAETLASDALGNVDWLPTTGHLLADFGFLVGEGGVANSAIGRGKKSIRLIELDPADPEPIVDLRLATDAATDPAGIIAYRAVWIPSVYPPGVVEQAP
ncbi:MAG: aryl-sulfate sulfotransferase, partial [Myxococcota bacterium]